MPSITCRFWICATWFTAFVVVVAAAAAVAAAVAAAAIALHNAPSLAAVLFECAIWLLAINRQQS
jgi:hypothetical protein